MEVEGKLLKRKERFGAAADAPSSEETDVSPDQSQLTTQYVKNPKVKPNVSKLIDGILVPVLVNSSIMYSVV